MTEPAAPKTNMSAITVAVVDDDENNRLSLQKIFEKEGFRVFLAENAPAALEICRLHSVHAVLTDLMMPGMSGIELIRALETIAPNVSVVVMTAYGTIEAAVEAMRQGAYDFVEKPLKRHHIVKTIRKAAERQQLVEENKSLRAEINRLTTRRIVGSSVALREALDVATQAAPSSANVLVLGESGTGKELMARYIHERSGRAGNFVAVNLAALPETIVEAELFGHERGAFTGAVQKREGRIAQAHGGTLFLDEIGELAPAVQVKLLRVLQEGEFEPLGGKTEHANFRLIAATNRDLRVLLENGRFREDLYYRLNVIAITCPPLRSRRDDVPLLVDHFLEVYARKNNKQGIALTRPALDLLTGYDWPGNVRELENVMERAVVLSRNATITADDLPMPIAKGERRVPADLVFSLGTPLEEVERRVIRATLDHTHGDKGLAAQLLGISVRTIYRRLGENEGDVD